MRTTTGSLTSTSLAGVRVALWVSAGIVHLVRSCFFHDHRLPGNEGHRIASAGITGHQARSGFERSPRTADVAIDFPGNGAKGKDAVGQTRVGDRSGHAPDDGARFVLN